MFFTYVAAPFADAGLVRDVHARLVEHDVRPTATWAEDVVGPENLGQYTTERLRAFAAVNDSDLRASNAMLVLAREGAGGEMFAEIARALLWGIPVVWSGRRTLSAYRRGVVLASDLEDGIRLIVAMRERFFDGYRGTILADVVGSAHAEVSS